MNSIEERIAAAFNTTQGFDLNVRNAMARGLQLDQYSDDTNPEHTGYKAAALLAIEVAVSLANLVMQVRRPDSGRSFRVLFDLTVGLQSNLFWARNAPVIMPLLHAYMMDHLDSVDLQTERGDVKISPYDKLIMGAEASSLVLFTQLLYLVGGFKTQAEGSVTLKKELMPLLMS